MPLFVLSVRAGLDLDQSGYTISDDCNNNYPTNEVMFSSALISLFVRRITQKTTSPIFTEFN